MRVELRMRLFAAQGIGGGATLRGWWLCRRGFLASGAEGGLAATCSWWWAGERVQAAGGEAICGPAASPHGKVASSLGQGYLGAGIPRRLAQGLLSE